MKAYSVGLSTGTRAAPRQLGLREDELGQLCPSSLSTFYPPDAAGLTLQGQGDAVPANTGAQSRSLAPSHVRASLR